jgi:hypothetical protein
MDSIEIGQALNRRHFLADSCLGMGGIALSSLLGSRRANANFALAGNSPSTLPTFQPKAKRVIYLFQSGAPSQFETFDYKPKLHVMRGEELPASVRMGQRLTTMTSGQSSFPVAPSQFSFSRHGESGTWVSSLLPHTARVADDLCVVHSMFTEAINHDPAIINLRDAPAPVHGWLMAWDR